MFYSEAILARKGALAKVWLAAHWERKLSKTQFLQANIQSSVGAIMNNGQEPMALRLSGQLLLGVVKIYSRKARYLLEDCSEALIKIKMAFRPGVVDLGEDQAVANFNAITNEAVEGLAPEPIFDLRGSWQEPASEGLSQNISRPQDITLRDSIGDDQFGLRPEKDLFGQEFMEEEEEEEIRLRRTRGFAASANLSMEIEVGRDAAPERPYSPSAVRSDRLSMQLDKQAEDITLSQDVSFSGADNMLETARAADPNARPAPGSQPDYLDAPAAGEGEGEQEMNLFDGGQYDLPDLDYNEADFRPVEQQEVAEETEAERRVSPDAEVPELLREPIAEEEEQELFDIPSSLAPLKSKKAAQPGKKRKHTAMDQAIELSSNQIMNQLNDTSDLIFSERPIRAMRSIVSFQDALARDAFYWMEQILPQDIAPEVRFLRTLGRGGRPGIGGLVGDLFDISSRDERASEEPVGRTPKRTRVSSPPRRSPGYGPTEDLMMDLPPLDGDNFNYDLPDLDAPEEFLRPPRVPTSPRRGESSRPTSPFHRELPPPDTAAGTQERRQTLFDTTPDEESGAPSSEIPYPDEDGAPASPAILPTAPRTQRPPRTQSLLSVQTEDAAASLAETAVNGSGWSKHTVRAVEVLRQRFTDQQDVDAGATPPATVPLTTTRRSKGKSPEQPTPTDSLDFDVITQQTTRTDTVRLFFELLVLASKGIVSVHQPKPYDPIRIAAKDDLWATGATSMEDASGARGDGVGTVEIVGSSIEVGAR